MTRTGWDAIVFARESVGSNVMPASGYCLVYVRNVFDVAAYYGSAIDAWNNAQFKHPGDRNPPAAVPLHFASPSPYDHITFGGDPAIGEVTTTFNDDVRRYTGDGISAVERDFDAQYLGWSEDLNEVRVWSAPDPGPGPDPVPPPPPEEDVSTYFEATSSDGPIIAGWVYEQGPDGQLRALGSSESGAHAQNHPQTWASRALWSGVDLHNLARSVGLYEYTGTAQTTPIGLTGRTIGRNASTTVPNAGGTDTSLWPGATVQADNVGTFAATRRATVLLLVLIIAVLIGVLIAVAEGATAAAYAGGGVAVGGLTAWLALLTLHVATRGKGNRDGA